MDVSAAARAAAREPDVMISAEVWRTLASNAQQLVEIAERLKAERDALRYEMCRILEVGDLESRLIAREALRESDRATGAPNE